MKTFTYTITDPIGIHARPAGILAKEVKKFKSEVIIEKQGKTVNAAKLVALMGMGIKCGDTINVNISGDDEETAALELEEFFKSNL
ncbi:MAG: HPr family phosphocarrier protein [Porcipelethomonas sp.]